MAHKYIEIVGRCSDYEAKARQRKELTGAKLGHGPITLAGEAGEIIERLAIENERLLKGEKQSEPEPKVLQPQESAGPADSGEPEAEPGTPVPSGEAVPILPAADAGEEAPDAPDAGPRPT